MDCKDDATLLDLLRQVGEVENMRSWLFDGDGEVSKWIMIDRDGEMVRNPNTPLADGNVIRLLTHISGG